MLKYLNILRMIIWLIDIIEKININSMCSFNFSKSGLLIKIITRLREDSILSLQLNMSI